MSVRPVEPPRHLTAEESRVLHRALLASTTLVHEGYLVGEEERDDDES